MDPVRGCRRRSWVILGALCVVAISLFASSVLPAQTPGGRGSAPAPVPTMPRAEPSLSGVPLAGPVASSGDAASAPGGAAPGAPTWIQICSTCLGSSSLSRSYGSMTWDGADGYAVLFGGENGGTSADGDTWTYNAAQGWKNVCNSCSPSGRAEAGMAYDSADSRVVMFGGCTGINLLSSTCNMGDSWTYAQGTWTQVSGTLPTGALAVSIADDPADGEVVMFGGCSQFNIDITNPSASACGSTNYLATTSVYTASGGWKTISPATSPSPREAAGMAYDPVLKEDILFGGYNGVHELSGTWAFSGGTWTNITPSVSPPAIANGAMFWDPNTQSIVLTQGDSAAGDVGETWEFSGGSWNPVYPATIPTPRDGVVCAAPTSGGLPVIFSGSTNSSNTQDTWAFGQLLVASASATPLATDIQQTVTFSSAIAGGQTPYAVSWKFGDGGSATTANASHAYTTPGTYTATFTVTDAYGQTVSHSLQVNISADPLVGAAASPKKAWMGNQTQFWGNVSGGTAPLSYIWDFGDGCTSPCATNANPTHVYTGPGSYTAKVSVVDAVGVSSSSEVNLTVECLLGALCISVTATPTTGTAPLNVTFTSAITGGTGPYHVQWAFGDGSPISTLANVTHDFTTGGTFKVTLNATDVNGRVGNSSTSIYVNPAPMHLAIFATPSAGELRNGGFEANFTEQLQGGMAPFNLTWSFGDNSPPSWLPITSHVYSLAGNFTALLTVRENPTHPGSVNATTVVTVAPTLVIGTPHIPSGSIAVGASEPYNVTLTGGRPPYQVTWDFGDGSVLGSAGPALSTTHSYAHGGTYNLTVWATDAFGVNVSSKIAVVVGGTTSAEGSQTIVIGGFNLLGGSYALVYLLLPIAVVAMLAAALFIGVEGGKLRPRAGRSLPSSLYSEPAYYPGQGWR